MTRRVLTPRLLWMAGLGVAIGMVVGIALFLVAADGVEAMAGGTVGGDFSAFYAAGDLARTTPSALLDPQAQYQAQQSITTDEWAPFPYPPVFAFLFVPVSLLPFTLAYAVYMVILAVTAVVAVRLVLDVLDVRDATWRPIALLGGVTWAATFRSVAGAQNATVVLLVLAAGTRLLQRGRPVGAGLVLGLLWFKPQFAVPALGLLVVSRWWRTAGLVGLAVGATTWGLHAAIFGVGWTQTWWREIITLTDVGNQQFNTGQTVSAVEYLRGTLPSPTGTVVGVAVALVLGLVAAVLVRRTSSEGPLLALVCAALLLSALHALPYDLVLLVPVVGLAMRQGGSRDLPVAVVVYLGAWAMIGIVSPVVQIAWVLAIVAWAGVRVREDAVGEPGPLAT